MNYECKRCNGNQVIVDPNPPKSYDFAATLVWDAEPTILCPRCNGTGIYVSRIRAGLAAPGKHGEFYVYRSSQRVTLTARTPGHPQDMPTEEQWRGVSNILNTKTVRSPFMARLRWQIRLTAVLDDFLPPHDFPPPKARPEPPLDFDAPCGCFVCMDIFKNGTRRRA